jgi:hypothetical protein
MELCLLFSHNGDNFRRTLSPATFEWGEHVGGVSNAAYTNGILWLAGDAVACNRYAVAMEAPIAG